MHLDPHKYRPHPHAGESYTCTKRGMQEATNLYQVSTGQDSIYCPLSQDRNASEDVYDDLG